jgi:hypothetical protein
MVQILGRMRVTRVLKEKFAPTLVKLWLGCGLHPRVKIFTHTRICRIGNPLGFGVCGLHP